MEHESDGDTNCGWDVRYSYQKIVKEPWDFEIREKVEAIQTRALLRSARILWRVLETWGDLPSLNLQWKAIS